MAGFLLLARISHRPSINTQRVIPSLGGGVRGEGPRKLLLRSILIVPRPRTSLIPLRPELGLTLDSRRLPN